MPPQFKKDAPVEVVSTLDAIERTADECFRPLKILRYPSNVAVWALLVHAVKLVEREQNATGSNTGSFDAALINIGRFLPIALKWVHRHGWKAEEPLASRWNSELAEAVAEAISIAHRYGHFETCFPLWHENRYLVELLSPTHARFSVGGTVRDRQVAAYQKGVRPSEGTFATERPPKSPQTPSVASLFQEVFDRARSSSALRFEYEVSPALRDELLKEYRERISLVTRRAVTLSMGPYSLEEFNNFYAALTAICAAHDHLCYSWGRAHGAYPWESAVLVRSREEWKNQLSSFSGVDASKCLAMIDDLTFRFDRSVDLKVHPFVPVDRDSSTLAVAPPFPLSSRHDENAMRVLSQVRRKRFDDTSGTKEEEILAALARVAGGRHSLQGPISLPSPVPDIDLLIVDESVSALAIIELKWIRKTLRTFEISDRDADVLKGFQQLDEVRTFLNDNPGYLAVAGRIARAVDHYESVFYLVVARDHWRWVDPGEGIAIVEYDAFVQALGRQTTIRDVVSELLRYEWLPVEGRDFTVRREEASVNGVTIESEIFYSSR